MSGLDPLCRLSRLPHIGPLLHGALQRLGLLLVHLHVVHFLIRGHGRGWGLWNRSTYGKRVKFWHLPEVALWYKYELMLCFTFNKKRKSTYFSVWAGRPRLKVQRKVIHVAAWPRGRAAGATYGWGGRRWVLLMEAGRRSTLSTCSAQTSQSLEQKGHNVFSPGFPLRLRDSP